jgi:hypothetical protein
MSDLTVDDVLMEAGYIPRWLEEGRKEGRKEDIDNLLKFGMAPEQVSAALKVPLAQILAVQEHK